MRGDHPDPVMEYVMDINTDGLWEKLNAEFDKERKEIYLSDRIDEIIKDNRPEDVIAALKSIALDKHYRLRELKMKYSQAARFMIELLKDDLGVNGMPGYKVDL